MNRSDALPYPGPQSEATSSFLVAWVESFVWMGISNRCWPPIPSCMTMSV
jgi:hypothetical protein